MRITHRGDTLTFEPDKAPVRRHGRAPVEDLRDAIVSDLTPPGQYWPQVCSPRSAYLWRLSRLIDVTVPLD
ncbi:MAG TPA: hypothetical protein VE953_11970 [Terriglobales bacterium]|nr:hypothetical protein [Terriglobales bacterium]